MRRASVVLPTPGGPHRMIEVSCVALDLHAQRLAGAQDVLLPDEVFQRLGPHALGQRALAASGGVRLGGRSGVEQAHGCTASLAARFVQQNAGGHRGVQRFHAGRWESEMPCAMRRAVQR